jgi:hypothetical protein
MSPICARENTGLATQLSQLSQFNLFISEVASAIVAGNHDFESVWSIANRVYDRHCSAKMTFMSSSLRSNREELRSAHSAH